MRIIAGTARSMPLKTLPGLDTRPTTDRIKETLFNMIQMEVPGCYFLDLFSGSGSIALEAVSRGARKAVLVENNKKAAACIQDNINFTKFNSYCDLKVMDAITAIRTLERKFVFDIVYMDPPYNKELEPEVLECLANSTIVNEDTLIIIEADIDRDVSVFESDAFYITRQKKYKTNQHVFLKKRITADFE